MPAGEHSSRKKRSSPYPHASLILHVSQKLRPDKSLVLPEPAVQRGSQSRVTPALVAWYDVTMTPFSKLRFRS